jgi:N-acetylglucosamine-6-phosphate deacetylase
LILEDGKIRAVTDPGDRQSLPEWGGQQVDGSGLIATPGWIDLQLNGGFGHDFTEDPSSIWLVAAQLPSLGITSFLPTIITCARAKLERAIEVFRQGPPDGWAGATPLGLHLEGPFLNPAKKGAHSAEYLREPDPAWARQWSRAGGVWLVTLAPELPGAREVINILYQNEVVMSGGHTRASYEQAQEAFAAGIRCSTHLFNAQPPIAHRDPGFAGAVLASPGIFTGLIADGVHVHPAMVSLAWKCKRGRLILVTDAVSALGLPPGRYSLGGYPVFVDNTSVRLADGTLAGSIITPEASIHNLAAWAGCSLAEAMQTMSSVPAELLGLQNKGQIATGADADLTLVTPDGQVAATIVGGNLLWLSTAPSRVSEHPN